MRLIFIMPIVATSATIGIIMKSIFSYDGFVNTIFSSLAGTKIEWLTEPKWAFLMILLVYGKKRELYLYIGWLGFR